MLSLELHCGFRISNVIVVDVVVVIDVVVVVVVVSNMFLLSIDLLLSWNCWVEFFQATRVRFQK